MVTLWQVLAHDIFHDVGYFTALALFTRALP